MAICTLTRTERNAYRGAFSCARHAIGRLGYAETHVLSVENGVQQQTGWLPLQGLTYDLQDDLLDVKVSGLNHLISHPEAIYIDEEAGCLRPLEAPAETE